jgi:hypothetical protein
MNLLTTLVLCALKEYVNNVKLYFISSEREREREREACIRSEAKREFLALYIIRHLFTL